ncbi:MAG: hypothetical protein COA45_04475 [Zetaproteobacteria bacterium]|nr:MAG: hypothetical protein COA45_04475 [Zetaproteobacteria bacterium]
MCNRRSVSSFLFLLFVFCVYGGEAFAVTDRCPRHQIKTELTAKLKKTKKFRASIEQINDYFDNHDRSSGTVLAFVSYGGKSMFIETRYSFGLKNIGHGQYCVMLDGVKSYFYLAPSIVMPKDYSKTSCEYKLILKHEKRHLNALYRYHKKYTGKYAAYQGRIARDVPIFFPVSSEEEAEGIRENIRNYFSAKFHEQIEKSFIELGSIQSKIDSPQEYRGVGMGLDRCAQDDNLVFGARY